MDNMALVDILNNILYPEVVGGNDMTNIGYFKQRMENEPVSEELMSESIGILEELLNSGELEQYVSAEKPENRQKRRANLNEFVKICETLAGVSKQSQKPQHPSFSPMQTFY
jgi:hypothetical protein